MQEFWILLWDSKYFLWVYRNDVKQSVYSEGPQNFDEVINWVHLFWNYSIYDLSRTIYFPFPAVFKSFYLIQLPVKTILLNNHFYWTILLLSPKKWSEQPVHCFHLNVPVISNAFGHCVQNRNGKTKVWLGTMLKTAHESIAGQGSEEQSPVRLLHSPVPQVRNHFSSCVPYLLSHIAEAGFKFLSKIPSPEIILMAGQSQTAQPFLFSQQYWNRSLQSHIKLPCLWCVHWAAAPSESQFKHITRAYWEWEAPAGWQDTNWI